MRGFQGFILNVVFINDKEILLKNNIYSIKIIENKIFLVLKTREGKNFSNEEVNNVYCYDYDGNFLWQIKSRIIINNPLYKPLPIASIIYNNDTKKLISYDFSGGMFEINQENGEIIKFLGATK